MPVVGIVHHRGRRTGHPYATPLGIRPAAAGGFVMPLTFGEAAGWDQRVCLAPRRAVLTKKRSPGPPSQVARPPRAARSSMPTRAPVPGRWRLGCLVRYRLGFSSGVAGPGGGSAVQVMSWVVLPVFLPFVLVVAVRARMAVGRSHAGG